MIDTDAQRGLRNIAGFWCLGLLNNILYVVMNAGANDIDSAGVGFVYLAGVLPALLVKGTGPYWFHLVSYRARAWYAAGLMVASLLAVALGTTTSVKLLGVALGSLQSGLGESSLLAMSALFERPQDCISAWSSGTGFAGIGGYVWSIMFTLMLHTSLRVQLVSALWIPACWLLVFHFVSKDMVLQERGSAACGGRGQTERRHSLQTGTATGLLQPVARPPSSVGERLAYAATLWPYVVPLMFVYAAEYAIQAGVWAAMGIPSPRVPADRHEWYKLANLTYQAGVFASRTFGGLVSCRPCVLWAAPALQVVMLAFFLVAAWVPLGGWWLLGPALLVGLLGGFVYVQAYLHLVRDQPASRAELALATVSVSDTLGIVLADAVAPLIQGCLFGRLGIRDTVPAFTCGYRIWG